MSVAGSITGPSTKRRSSAQLSVNGDVQHTAPPGEEASEEDQAVDHDIVLEVVLPDGSSRQLTVNSNIPMMDLLVHCAATSRLSPITHLLVVRDAGGHVREYRPNQSIGTLGVDTVYLEPKAAKMEKRTSKSDVKPFEITNRLIIKLPHGQMMVLRVSLQTKLSEIFTIICSEKGLDSFVHELRHPKNYELELNVDQTLQEYGLNEVKVVNIKAPLSSRGSDDDRSIHSTNASDILPPSIHIPPAVIEQVCSPSPEKEHKKKKGLKLGFKKKDKKKKAAKEQKGSIYSFDDSHHHAQLEVPREAMTKQSTVNANVTFRSKSSHKHDPAHRHTMPPEALMDDHQKAQLTLTKSKKRHAPPPPPGGSRIKSNIEGSSDIVAADVGPEHQASMGKIDTGQNQVSVSTSLTQINASSGVGSSVDFGNDKRSHSAHDISMSSVASTLKVVKKKRRAPAPPQSPTSPNQNGDITMSIPPKPPRPMSVAIPSTVTVDESTKPKRPCSFIAPPPPDTPPPEDVPIVSLSGVVSKSVSTSFSPDVDVEMKPDFASHINGDHTDSQSDTSDLHAGAASAVEVKVPEDQQSVGGTIDDVNLAFENVIAEAEKVMDGDEVYTHKTEMARFVESMRSEAEDRAKINVEVHSPEVDDLSLPTESDTETVIHHESETQSEVNSNLEASGHLSFGINGDDSADAQKVALDFEEPVGATIAVPEETAPTQFSIDSHEVSNGEHFDHSEDILAHSNLTVDSGIGQSDRQEDNVIEEMDSAFDSINIEDHFGGKLTGPRVSVTLDGSKDLDIHEEVTKEALVGAKAPPARKAVCSVETGYDGDVSTENGAMDSSINTSVKIVDIDVNVLPDEVNVHSPIVAPVDFRPKTPEPVSSPELPKRLIHESSPKEITIETKRAKSPEIMVAAERIETPRKAACVEIVKEISIETRQKPAESPKVAKETFVTSKSKENVDSFGVTLRRTNHGSNVVFETGSKPNADVMVQVKAKETPRESKIIQPPKDSKVFTIGKDDEVFDFEKIRQRALAAQKEKSKPSMKYPAVAGSRPKSDIQKQCSELSFQPNAEGEAEHMLEEKSILMMPRQIEVKPVEVKVRDPEPKMVSIETLKPAGTYRSSTNVMLVSNREKSASPTELVQIGARSIHTKSSKPDEVDFEVHTIPRASPIPRDEIRAKNHPETKRQISLSTLMMAHLPPKVEPASESHRETSKEDPELQQKLEQLQAQFSDLQKQYAANEALLLQKQAAEEHASPSVPTPPTPPPAPLPSSVPAGQVGTVTVAPVPIPPAFIIKSDAKPVRARSNPKRFEKELDPREELMIAIRNVGGRTALRKVPVKETNWGVKIISQSNIK